MDIRRSGCCCCPRRRVPPLLVPPHCTLESTISRSTANYSSIYCRLDYGSIPASKHKAAAGLSATYGSFLLTSTVSSTKLPQKRIFLRLLLSTNPSMSSSPPSCVLEETSGKNSQANVLSSDTQPSVLADLPNLSVDQLNQYLTSALAQLQQSVSSCIALTFTAAGVTTDPICN